MASYGQPSAVVRDAAKIRLNRLGKTGERPELVTGLPTGQKANVPIGKPSVKAQLEPR